MTRGIHRADDGTDHLFVVPRVIEGNPEVDWLTWVQTKHIAKYRKYTWQMGSKHIQTPRENAEKAHFTAEFRFGICVCIFLAVIIGL